MRRRIDLLVGGIFVTAVFLIQFEIMGIAIIGFNILLVISFIVWLTGEDYLNPNPQRVVEIYLLGISFQCLHLAEEYIMNFQKSLPGLFNYQWPDKLFLLFNLIWLCIFVLAAWGALHKNRFAYLIIWIYAIIGGVGNGIFHTVISIMQLKYFPGLFSSYGNLIVGIILIKESLKVRREINRSVIN